MQYDRSTSGAFDLRSLLHLSKTDILLANGLNLGSRLYPQNYLRI